MIPFCLEWNVQPCRNFTLWGRVEAVSTEYMETGQPRLLLLFGHFQYTRTLDTLDARYGDIAVLHPRP
jgi:hypothetical protein